MRILKSSPFYTAFLDDLYASDHTLASASYETQLKSVMSQCVGWADSYKRNFERIPGYEVVEIVTNAEHLQKQWAKEHGFRYSEDNWLLDILEAQLVTYEPDVWFCHDFTTADPAFRMKARKRCPSIKLVLGWDGCALNTASVFGGCDVVMSCAEFVADYYAGNGFKTFFFAHCFDPEVFKYISAGKSTHEISFIGSLITRNDFHHKRMEFLAKLSRRLPLSLWVSSFAPASHRDFLVEQLSRLRRGQFQDFLDVLRIARLNKGNLFGLQMYQTLTDSKMTINLHTDVAGNKAGNMRLFEATGVGTCLVTDWQRNLDDFFVIDEEVVAYRSVDECVEKMKYLLENEEARTSIAKAGQERTLQQHSFGKQIERLAKFLESLL